MHLPLTQRSSWGRQRPGARVGVIIVLVLVVLVLLLLDELSLSRSRCCAKAAGGMALALRVGAVTVAMLNLLVVRFARCAEYLNLFSESLVIIISLLSRKFTKPRKDKGLTEESVGNARLSGLPKPLGPPAAESSALEFTGTGAGATTASGAAT